jgi:hypothetical protein
VVEQVGVGIQRRGDVRVSELSEDVGDIDALGDQQ